MADDANALDLATTAFAQLLVGDAPDFAQEAHRSARLLAKPKSHAAESHAAVRPLVRPSFWRRSALRALARLR
eukprot:6231226-Alexandrium_andersonii.AAC.1